MHVRVRVRVRVRGRFRVRIGIGLGLVLFENILIPMHKYCVGVEKYCQRNRRTITYHFRGKWRGGG